jgi:hypothetical protein
MALLTVSAAGRGTASGERTDGVRNRTALSPGRTRPLPARRYGMSDRGPGIHPDDTTGASDKMVTTAAVTSHPHLVSYSNGRMLLAWQSECLSRADSPETPSTCLRRSVQGSAGLPVPDGRSRGTRVTADWGDHLSARAKVRESSSMTFGRPPWLPLTAAMIWTFEGLLPDVVRRSGSSRTESQRMACAGSQALPVSCQSCCSTAATSWCDFWLCIVA